MVERYQETPGIPHIIRLTSDAQWEVVDKFKKSTNGKGTNRYCYLYKSQFKYEYFFFFNNKRNVSYWMMDIKGVKMPRWLIDDEIYQEIKFKTLDVKKDQYGTRLFIRNPDNYEELKNEWY